MPDDDFILDCLDQLGDGREPGAAIRLAADRSSDLLAAPGTAAALLSGPEGDTDRRLRLFAALVERARLDVEGGGRLGLNFLHDAEEAIDGLLDDGGLEFETALALARAYGFAGIEAPESLLSFLVPGIAALPGKEGYAVDFDAEVDTLRRHAGVDAHALHILLADSLALVPASLRPGLVHHVAGRDRDDYGLLALYWLLDGAAEIRLAAAGGLLQRARRGSLDAASASALPLIRTWIPADGARPLLDAALREARRRGLAGPVEPSGLRPVQLLGTVPDASGGQSFAAALEGRDGPAAALVLVKAGQGVKDAFLVHGDDARDALSSQVAGSGAFAVAWEALEPALKAALADGFAAGRPPAAGLIDVASALGLMDLRPRAMTGQDWLACIDPAGEVAGLPARRRDRLIRGSANWPGDHEHVAGWCEGTATVDRLLDGAGGAPQLEAALWTYLDERRGHWALLMLRTAHVLRAGGDADWPSFAATAAALLEGRALKKVPIMEHILRASIAAWQVEEYGLAIGFPDDGAWPGSG